MRIRLYFLLAGIVALSVAARAEEGLSPDSLAWNEGLAAYQAGDVTNALRVLRPLLASKTHGARAGELVSKLEYDQAHELGATNMLAHLESAAKAAQIALRANPDDARANANFTRATDGLAALRETTRVNAVLAAAEGKDPATQLKGAVTDSRALLTELKRLTEAEPARQVELADELEKKAKRLADVWLPIRETVSQNVTNEEALAQITGQIDTARDLTANAARLAGDLDAAGAGATAAQAEDAFTGFYKMVVLPPEAIHESLISQTNACAGVEPIGARSWQGDAVGYTQAFRKRFPQWADAYEQQRQADTNAPPLTAETRAKIEDLAEKLEAEQIACCQEPEKERQDKAAALAGEILQLMPVPPQPPPQQNQQNQQQNQQQQNQQQQNKQDQQQQDQQNQDQQDQQQNQQQAEDDEKPDEKQQEAAEAQEEEKSPEEKEDEALLRRVQERSAEHQMEMRRRAGQRRVTKDW